MFLPLWFILYRSSASDSTAQPWCNLPTATFTKNWGNSLNLCQKSFLMLGISKYVHVTSSTNKWKKKKFEYLAALPVKGYYIGFIDFRGMQTKVPRNGTVFLLFQSLVPSCHSTSLKLVTIYNTWTGGITREEHKGRVNKEFLNQF